MKLAAIDNTDLLINTLLSEAANPFMDMNGDDDYSNIELSYQQLEVLETAMSTGNFGVFINRPANKIRSTDIPAIKNAILKMLVNNKFFEGVSFTGGNGVHNLKLLGYTLGHAIELVLLAALTAALAGFAGFEILHADVVLAALSGAGAAVTGYGVSKQVQSIRALYAAYRLSEIIKSYNDVGTMDYHDYHRGVLRSFLDFIEGKSKEQIHEEMSARIEQEANRKQEKFDSKISNLPKYIHVIDSDGEQKEYPTAELFNFN